LKVLVTCARSEIARTVSEALEGKHDLTLTDIPAAGASARKSAGIAISDLNHDEATDRLVAGFDAVVHIGYGGQTGDATQLLDYYSRRTYNLLLAAANAKVSRCVYLSTLRLLGDYEENLTVTERWRPLPPSDDPDLLACHIGEIVCKEFARDRLIKVATLRLGWPIVSGPRAEAVRTGETAALATDDLAMVLDRALSAEIDQWQDVHVQSPVPDQRYLMQAAERLFSFPKAPRPPAAAAPRTAVKPSRKGGRR
jgi:nucleoside-diphosphate-sugar epimerase